MAGTGELGDPGLSFSATGSGEGYTNLTSLALSDDLYVGDDASIIGDLDVTGSTSLGTVTLGATTLTGLTVNGNATITGTTDLQGTVYDSGGTFTLGDNVSITGTLTVAGATTLAAADLNGTTLTLDADADTTLAAGTDDIPVLTLGAAAGYLNVLTGNLKVGNETPDVTLNGEDAYIEGTLEVDGTTRFDGAMTVNANGDFDSLSTLAIDSDSYYDSTGDMQINDNLNITGTLTAAGNTDLAGTAIITGNLTLGALFLPGFTDLTISVAGQVLTPTRTVYALDSGGAISMTLAAVGTEGQLLILIGDDANNITIADTNLRSHDGAALVLGQYDVAMLVYQDAEWIQLVELANQ
jgi:cytoskeletal protein CcmA (bactofilin family)